MPGSGAEDARGLSDSIWGRETTYRQRKLPRGKARRSQLTLDPLEQQGLPVALLQLLLEQSVAGPGAGQEKPEALGAESPQSEVSLDPGAPGRKALPRVWGAGACT